MVKQCLLNIFIALILIFHEIVIDPFINYLLRVFHVRGKVLGRQDTTVHGRCLIPSLMELTV